MATTPLKFWPGDPAATPHILICPCGSKFETWNPRSAVRCPACRKKAKTQASNEQHGRRTANPNAPTIRRHETAMPDTGAPPEPLVSKIRVRCEKCSEMFGEAGISRHRSTCKGNPRKLPVGHSFCICGRIKPKSARTCFQCETVDSGCEWLKRKEAFA